MNGAPRIDADKTVVMLTRDGYIEFPQTLRLGNDFLVTGDLVIVNDYYGGLHGYDLKSGTEVSRIILDSNKYKGMATDGEFFYLHLKGVYQLQDSDVLLALSRGEENNWFAEWIGRPWGELPSIRGSTRESYGIESSIAYFPLDLMRSRSILFAPENLGKERPRFLVYEDMSTTSLQTCDGYVFGFYNKHCGEGGCSDGFVLKGGKAYHLQNKEAQEIEKAAESRTVKIPSGIRIDYSHGDEVVRAYETQSDGEGDSEGEDAPKIEPLHVIFHDKRPPVMRNVLSVSHQDDKFYVLRDQQRGSDSTGWVTRVYEPHRFERYAVSLRSLS